MFRIMRKYIVITVFILFSLSSFAQDGKSIYQKYSDEQGVSAVYISPAMFRMIGKLPDMEMGNDSMNLTPVIKSLRGMYIISMENSPLSINLRDDVQRFVNKGRYELMMEVKDSGEQVKIFTDSQGDMVSSLVLMAAEADACTFICVDGNISMNDLESLISSVVQ